MLHQHTHTPLFSLSILWEWGVTAFLLKTSCWVHVMIYTNYTECIMITITGIAQIVLDSHIITLAKLNLFFLSRIFTFVMPG
jgi:hypothetical protein